MKHELHLLELFETGGILQDNRTKHKQNMKQKAYNKAIIELNLKENLYI